jgi:hypothetical protein
LPGWPLLLLLGFVLWLWLGLLLTGAALIVLSWMVSSDSAP